MRNTQSQEEDELVRLKDEISMLGRINHPNIVRCLGATQHDGHINIFIEWMAGKTTCLRTPICAYSCYHVTVT